LLNSAHARIEVQIHVALPLLRVVEPVGQYFELAAQAVDLGLQVLDLIHELDHAGRAAIGRMSLRRRSGGRGRCGLSCCGGGVLILRGDRRFTRARFRC
jgi:hypothetical protein